MAWSCGVISEVVGFEPENICFATTSLPLPWFIEETRSGSYNGVKLEATKWLAMPK
jgi:hypothetical protein